MDRTKMLMRLRQDGYYEAADLIESFEQETVVEYCANCESEIQMKWNVATDGYQVYCPVCGNRLMLCDECMHSNPDGSFTGFCDYSRKTDSCFHQKRFNE